ncbi:hypothetical protein [uncultured Kordia sp.]|uniref:hypothetical protein n=1 Tax=uncultured Kordia sp. TaxID=507699 RepID=UPI00260F44D4|nr:hypothetical protein [uncultured Kordia sp.]
MKKKLKLNKTILSKLDHLETIKLVGGTWDTCHDQCEDDITYPNEGCGTINRGCTDHTIGCTNDRYCGGGGGGTGGGGASGQHYCSGFYCS